MEMIQELMKSYPWISIVLMSLGGLCVTAQMVVVITPTKKDDAYLAKIQKGVFGKLWDFFVGFAPVQKKK